MENRIAPFDRAHKVVLEANLEPIFRVPGRIAASIILVVPYVLWWKTSILEFFHAWFELSKIGLRHSIELIGLYLEQIWNQFSMFLGESQQELLESAANFTYVF